jgi:lysophospholipase L1-like esterase
MSVLDAPTYSRLISDLRFPLRRRPFPPMASALGLALSAISGTTTVEFSKTVPTFTHERNLTTPNCPYSAHGAVIEHNSSFNYDRNVIAGGGSNAWAVGVEYLGKHLALKLRPQTTTAQYWVFVNDQPLTAAPVALTALTTGETYNLNLVFAETGVYRVKVYISELDFIGYRCEKALDGYGPCPLEPLRIVFWGDSWTQGANKIYLNHFPLRIARALGAQAFLAGQGGTGYVNETEEAGKSKFGSAKRIEAAIPAKPDLIWVFGSVNDRAKHALVEAAAKAFYASLAEAFPQVPLIVDGVQSVSEGAGFFPELTETNTAVQKAAAAAPNVKALYSSWTEKWIDGSGNITTPKADGNADTMMNTENIHLTEAGNQYYAGRMLAKLALLLTNV